MEKNYLPAGYIYVKLSNGKADKVCAKAAVTAGLPVNTCIDGGVSSYKMQLQTDSCSGAVVEVYNDGNCSSREPTVISLEPYADQCNPYTGQQDITMGGVTVTVPLYFWTLSCTAQPSKPIPVASVALELYSDANTCDKYLGYVSVAPDLCLLVNNGLASIALKCSKTGAVNLIQYFGGACGFAIGSTPYAVNTCAAASSAIPKGYGRTIGSTSSFSLSRSAEQTPHSSLRAKPSEKTLHISRTHALTNEPLTEEEIVAELTQVMSAGSTEVASFIASCAQPNTNYAAIILVSQVLRAVDISSFLANEAANHLALQKTIASCLTASTTVNSVSALPAGSVRWSDVFITSALPVSGTASAADVVVGDLVKTHSTPLPSLALTYTVLSYHAGVSNTKLASALQQSVESGVFVDLLHQTAASEGATALLVATSEAVSGVDEGSGGGGDGGAEGDEPVVTSSEGNTSPSEKLSGPALIGTIVGGVSALLLVCAGLVYYFFLSTPTDKGDSLATLDRPHTVTAVIYGGVSDAIQCPRFEMVPSASAAAEVEMRLPEAANIYCSDHGV
uniref:Transmembrane protein n=1 Tax=Spumella elongata TaxID=89044 RepID=A0A7S3HDK0_9STRA|mmetsp:Transcript_47120/g.82292  ORF Transcript_47120/g.82292 Transcript_47120/m.82292 type:complete len:562 (+) Transcript_47120:186-1871(+)|eukprot:CAMPEP_0184992088 /NCGR_PEP_ID=MMETSP1098-20130426/39635_1 /TAXON_ID=89044 /ORGANISM="Spumella elongata, Strain CCAP 955/1" /LENGTH=561 /DNA_ID=CAMNT_0027517637 /DNA_START=186 /DNA_END=1871 /DNA_ORIENTATION=-